MGVSNDGMQGLSQGLSILSDTVKRTGLIWPQSLDMGGVADEEARLNELDALDEAAQYRRDANQDIRQDHAARERRRSGAQAGWGQSGVALSGSRKMVLDSRRDQDIKDEGDLAFRSEQDEKALLNSGLRRANRYRISRGRSPRSTLSLGSTIYTKRR